VNEQRDAGGLSHTRAARVAPRLAKPEPKDIAMTTPTPPPAAPPPTNELSAVELRDALALTGTGAARLSVLDAMIGETPGLSATAAAAAVADHPAFGDVTKAKIAAILAA